MPGCMPVAWASSSLLRCRSCNRSGSPNLAATYTARAITRAVKLMCRICALAESESGGGGSAGCGIEVPHKTIGVRFDTAFSPTFLCDGDAQRQPSAAAGSRSGAQQSGSCRQSTARHCSAQELVETPDFPSRHLPSGGPMNSIEYFSVSFLSFSASAPLISVKSPSTPPGSTPPKRTPGSVPMF